MNAENIFSIGLTATLKRNNSSFHFKCWQGILVNNLGHRRDRKVCLRHSSLFFYSAHSKTKTQTTEDKNAAENFLVNNLLIDSCPCCLFLVHQTMPLQKLHDGILASLHGLKNSKFKMASKTGEINMKAASKSCIYTIVCV